MRMHAFDETPCHLGEGPLWHPVRGQLLWFDILRFRLHSNEAGKTRTWQFEEHVSAAGWLDVDRLLIASETKLFTFNLDTGAAETVAPLEADRPETRSNDGRADPWGGFWIGTMGKDAETGAGTIYRYYRGELRCLVPRISITNAICFSPDRRHAYFTDTPTQKIMRQPLAEADGWPEGTAEVWLDLSGTEWRPDGAVVDAEGNLWSAQWGGNRVAAYAPNGAFLRAVEVPGAHSSCPAFGGAGLTDLFCTTARAGLSSGTLAREPYHGHTFVAEGVARGQAEHQVVL